MKFYRNLVIIAVVTIVLFSASINFAERSTGNNVYIYLIAGGAIALISRLLINLNFGLSLKKDFNATPDELVNKHVEFERNYTGEIFLSIAAVIFFLKGYKEYTLLGLTQTSSMYFVGGTAFTALIIKNIINKKSRIKKIENISTSERNNLKNYSKIAIYAIVILFILNFFYKFFK